MAFAHIRRPMSNEKFPIDLSALKPLKLDPKNLQLTDEQKAVLQHNIQLCRDVIVFFTALAGGGTGLPRRRAPGMRHSPGALLRNDVNRRAARGGRPC